MYVQDYAPVADSLAWSALLAAIPLVLLFVLLGVVRMKAWQASLIGLATSLVVAVAAYGMPFGTALASGSQGAAFGLFPAMWVVINAIWVYQLTVESGHFDVLRRSFGGVSEDQRIQALIIAFCFGALLEALAGFGAPVAITAVMLIALGFRPLKAAAVGLVANTAPVAFGAVALPIVTLSAVTGISERDLAEMVARQTPILALFVPFALVLIVDGVRGVRECWLAALVCGVTFAVGQFTMASYGSIALADIVAAFLAAACTVGLLRVWQPRQVRGRGEVAERESDGEIPTEFTGGGGGIAGGGGGGTATLTRSGQDTRADILLAYFPYALIVVVFSIFNIPMVKDFFAEQAVMIEWPGVFGQVADAEGVPLSSSVFKLDWMSNIGTLLFVIGMATALVLRLSPTRAAATYVKTLKQLFTAIVTVVSVLALAYVMNSSGQTVTLGLYLAQVGGMFALVSPIVGWLGTAITGSDTSSNALFGLLQVEAARAAGIDPTLTAAANTSGGVLGKMVSPQNLAVGAAAVSMAGREGELFRRVLGWTLVFLAGLCVLVFLQSTPVLSWMLPG